MQSKKKSQPFICHWHEFEIRDWRPLPFACFQFRIHLNWYNFNFFFVSNLLYSVDFAMHHTNLYFMHFILQLIQKKNLFIFVFGCSFFLGYIFMVVLVLSITNICGKYHYIAHKFTSNYCKAHFTLPCQTNHIKLVVMLLIFRLV